MVKKLSNQKRLVGEKVNFGDLCHKCLSKGYDDLTESELISLVLEKDDHDNSDHNSIQNLLVDEEFQLSQWGPNELMKRFRLSAEDSVRFAGIWELSRRKWNFIQGAPIIRNSSDAFRLFYSQLVFLNHESFHVALLNRANKVVHRWELSKGGIHSTVVDVRLLIKQALEYNSIAIIVAHNHPSGNVQPSQEDRTLTEKLKQASKYFDFTLMDHIVISGEHYFSFADEGLL
ncbi:MAG: JAB domain-containing protein [Bacteroidota bacterium]|nr:JAB domain-containing protein [Bacteroidota bacterium]